MVNCDHTLSHAATVSLFFSLFFPFLTPRRLTPQEASRKLLKLAGGDGALTISFLASELEEQQKSADASKKRVLEIQGKLKTLLAERGGSEGNLEEGKLEEAAAQVLPQSSSSTVMVNEVNAKEDFQVRLYAHAKWLSKRVSNRVSSAWVPKDQVAADSDTTGHLDESMIRVLQDEFKGNSPTLITQLKSLSNKDDPDHGRTWHTFCLNTLNSTDVLPELHKAKSWLSSDENSVHPLTNIIVQMIESNSAEDDGW